VQSPARERLRGRDQGQLSYDDLLERTEELLAKSSRIRGLTSARWGLVVCDETQDTSDAQWRLLQLIATRKVMLLGDPNQMIYAGFIRGVSVEGFQRIREWADREIELLPRSHRDPSGAIPAMAEAVRTRDFQNDAVIEAIKSGRLTIHFNVGDPQLGEYLR
jgi:DNA helicase II / ATP-dependent DNA helicase PcrA